MSKQNTTWSRLRRWLRHTWLSRLPLVGPLLGIAPASSAPPKKRKREELRIEELERRWVCNDMLSMSATALAGGIVAEMAATFRTPTQVLIHGWGANQPGLPEKDQWNGNRIAVLPSLTDEASSCYFLSLSVSPPLKEEAEATTKSTERSSEQPTEESRRERLVSASSALTDPLHDGDFLSRLSGALGDPLADDTTDKTKEKGGGGGGAMSLDTTPLSMGDGSVGFAPENNTNAPSFGGGSSERGRSNSDDFAGMFPNFTSSSAEAPEQTALLSSPDGGDNLEAVAEPLPPPVLQPDFGNLPLGFEVNRGQTDSEVQFLGRGQGYALYLTTDEIVLALNKLRPAEGEQSQEMIRDVVRIGFVGASGETPLAGEDLLSGRVNYLQPGEISLALTDIPVYEAVVARDVWDGVDVLYQGEGQSLRYDLIVAAGADVGAIELAYSGVDSLSLDEEGNLVLSTAGGDVIQQGPLFYQETAEGRKEVTGRYLLGEGNKVAFEVDDYDSSRELVIDPTISYSGYLGGSSTDNGNGVAVDSQGNVYVVGTTFSSTFPGGGSVTGTSDLFVTKYNPQGTGVVYTTLVNVSGVEEGLGIAVDTAGAAYVVGSTATSTTPSTKNALVAKLNAAGNNLAWSMTMSGSNEDVGRAIAVNDKGVVYVAGDTLSTNLSTVSAYQSGNDGNRDAWVAKINASGSATDWLTYLGGSSDDSATGITVDGDGRAFVTGWTRSSNFDTTGGAYQTTFGGIFPAPGTADAFITRFDSGSSLGYSTFLGGSQEDLGLGIAVDKDSQAVVVGRTASSDFALGSGFSLSGIESGYLVRLNAAGSSANWVTRLANTSYTEASAVTLDNAGTAYVTGWTSDYTTWQSGSPVVTGGGGYDAFAARLESGVSTPSWVAIFGGNSDDEGNAIALSVDRDVAVVGSTASSNFPTTAPLQGSSGGGTDAFLTRFGNLTPPALTEISDDSGTSDEDFITNDDTLTLTGTAAASADVNIYRDDLGYLATVTANGSGAWSYNYTGTSLAEGTHAFTFTTTVSSQTGLHSRPYLVTVDQTDTTVTLSAAATTYDLTPEVRVVATDEGGLPATGTIFLDADLNNDDDFGDTSEMGYATGTMTAGLALFQIGTALSIGTVKVRARYSDLAGNEGTSNIVTVAVQSSGSAFTATDVTAQVDPLGGNALLQRGSLTFSHLLDLDKSPGTAVGLNPALVFNAERVDVKPIITATVQTDNGQALPATITAHLTFNGTTQSPQAFSTSGRTGGELLTIAQQVSSPVLTTGYYQYTMTLVLDYGSPITRTVSGGLYAVAEDSSAFGAGWTVGGVDRLVTVTGGLLREYGWGGHSFYADLGGGTYDSPAGDNGTLTSTSGGGVTTYTYETPDEQNWTFNNGGRMVKWTSPDTKAVVSYTYSGSQLDKIETPDGALTTFTYSSYLDTIQTGSRVVTLTHTGSDLTKITNPDGGLHTLTYASHKLTREDFATLRTTFAYDSGVLTSYRQGEYDPVTLTPATLFGLSALAAAVRPSVVDGLGRTMRWELDRSGRVMREINPDGGVTTYTRDGEGWVTEIADPLSRLTTFTLDGSGYTTEVENPDGTTAGATYQAPFHAMTEYRDELGKLWTFTYDGGGHMTSQKDPLNFLTTATYNSTSGLLETVKDALNRVTTYLYDSARRLETVIHPNLARVTLSYDANGNMQTYKDELSRVTTYTNDSLGRVLGIEYPTGQRGTYAYDGAGLPTTAVSAASGTITYEHDAAGQQTRVVEAVGTSVQRSSLSMFDDAGQQTGSRDANGVETDFAYDVTGRYAGTTDALGYTTKAGYDLSGQSTRSFDELGRVSRDTYDELGRVIASRDALGNVTTTVYDDAGNVSGTINALGVRTSYVYDAVGRQTVLIEAVGTGLERRTTTVYNAVGLVTERIDALGRSTENEYDSLNRLTTITEAVGTSAERMMTLAYDNVGNQTSVTDWRGYRTDRQYDSLNRLTTLTEAVGTADERLMTYAYDSAGRLAGQTDWRGFRTTFAYDDLGQQLSRTEGIGGSVTRTTGSQLDALGSSVGTVDALGKVWGNTNDVLGRPSFDIDPLGNKTRTLHNAAGDVSGSVDALGHRTEYLTDALGRTTKMTNALSGVASTVYDELSRVTAQVDELGNRTTFTYDALNRQTEVKDALGKITTTVYDAVDNVLAVVDARGNRTSYTYDALNRQTEVKDALTRITTSVYDDAGNMTERIDPLLHRTTFTFDALNRQASVEDAEGNLTEMDYDDGGNVIAVTDARGNITTSSYDNFNQLIQVEDEIGILLTNVYDAVGRKIAEVDGRGNRTTFTYDSAGRVVARTDALNHTTTSVFDAAGNVTKSIDAGGFTTTFAYDSLNRQIRVQDPGGGINTTVYDAASRVVNTIDPLTNKTTFAYDAVNRLKETTDARGYITTQLYDDVGNRTTLVDPVGNRTTFTFDALNRVSVETDPFNKAITYAFDEAGRHITTTDRLSRKREFQYDDANRATGEVWKDSGNVTLNILTYTLDGNGNREVMKDQNGAYTYAYDARNRVTEQKGLFGVTLTFTYDLANNRTKVQDSFGGLTTSVYNAVNLLTHREFTGSSATISFDQAYSVRNQVTTLTRYSDLGSTKIGDSLSTYDSAGRLTNLKHRDGSSNVLANFTYTYDLASRVTGETLNGTTTSYAYDATSQLTHTYDGTTPLTYSYDGNGNRTMTGYATTTGNRMTNDGTFTYTYDDQGNLTKKSMGASAETWTYNWDNRNQMTGVEKRATDGGTLQMKATYVYDVWGNRVEKQVYTSGVGTTTERFVQDGFKNPKDSWGNQYSLVGLENFDIAIDLDGNNTLTMRRLYGDMVDQVTARVSSGGVSAWYLGDYQGSVQNIMNNSGTLINTITYEGFGKIASESNPLNGDAYGFQGRTHDDETGDIHYRDDPGNPNTGRRYEHDPKWPDSGPNPYEMFGNNPTNATDPSGLKVFWAVRDMDGDLTVGNHSFLVIVPDEPDKFDPSLLQQLGGKYRHNFNTYPDGGYFKGFTISGSPSEDKNRKGQMDTFINHKSDVTAAKEYFGGVDEGLKSILLLHYSTQMKLVPMPEEFKLLGKRGDTLWIMILLSQLHSYNKQGRSPYFVTQSDCFTLTKEMLWSSTELNNEQLIEMGDFNGHDGILGFAGRKEWLPGVSLRESKLSSFFTSRNNANQELGKTLNEYALRQIGSSAGWAKNRHHYCEKCREKYCPGYAEFRREQRDLTSRRISALVEELYNHYSKLFGLNEGEKIKELQ